MRRKTSRALRIALSPSHGVEPWALVPWTSTRTASTPLAWTPMWRSVGSPVRAKSARRPSATSASVERRVDVLGLLVGDAQQAHADAVLRGRVDGRAQQDGERALHVVGAAPDEAVALDAGRELPLARRHDVEVPVEDHRGRVARPDVGQDDRQAVERALLDRDLAGLEPALDEGGGGAQPFGLGRVVAHQALGQDPLVHPGQDRARRRSHPAVPALRDMFGAMAAQIVLFGATGYTGELTARALVERGARPVLAARSRGRLEALAAALGGLEARVADVRDPATVRALVGAGDVLVSTVGPFVRFGGPAVEAALGRAAPTTSTRPARRRSSATSSSATARGRSGPASASSRPWASTSCPATSPPRSRCARRGAPPRRSRSGYFASGFGAERRHAGQRGRRGARAGLPPARRRGGRRARAPRTWRPSSSAAGGGRPR